MKMSFFGKLKSLHSGPPAPAPPRRTGHGPDQGWPQNEFEEEEGDMYEAPPIERPAAKVPPRHVEENVYLERTSGPAVPQRQAAPHRLGRFLRPHRTKELSLDSNTKKPPEIDRNDKPGRKKMAAPPQAPPPVRALHAPPPTSNAEEDVYLDPYEEQEDHDDLYLEPAAACPPAPRGPMRRPPSPKAAFVSSSVPMAKPPVPRAKSQTSLLPSPADARAGPPFPAKPPPPAPGFRPPLPANHKEAKPSPPSPQVADAHPAAFSGASRATKTHGDEDKDWFAGECSRRAAEDLLLAVNKDGAFLIRNSSAQNARQPFTLAVFYQQKVYNIPVRFLEETRSYVLGKEGKKNEEMFGSLDEMIDHHKNNQLLLIDSKSQAKHSAFLTRPALR